MKSHRLPQIDMSELKLPPSIVKAIEEAEKQLAHRPKLSQLFRNCFPNTLETTTKLMEDGSTFVLTGDIPAMWLRDSVEQVIHYVPFAKEDAELQRILEGVIKRHMFYIRIDPYANAFNETANDWHWNSADETESSPWVWERKFELDSMCFSFRLAYHYWKETGRTSIFNEQFKSSLLAMLDIWQIEQRHGELSTYRFQRHNGIMIDTLRRQGRGMPVGETGMIWSGFRPSDDACDFHFNIPSNMFAAVTLRDMGEIVRYVYRDEKLAARMAEMEEEIRHAIELYGIVEHPKYGRMYAFETDGYGNHVLMDDAGTPSLISAPYIGFTDASDPIYLNTRAFILSEDNPYYYKGDSLSGIGSPHTPPDFVWHLAYSMQGLTAVNPDEIREMIDIMEATDADTGFMHEGFHKGDPANFTRDWFAWSNSQFAHLVWKALQKGII
ncbi:glycoside hydrolase family 125 protein [Paenibacillus sp. LHD-38]|uniref:glycoside hydrolase family 125 protein n=1 Tax=Paenibacillus sp. LHD-38 TaxID=3072143 RepID=UPI00281060EB|nr:glycoside hydrolase family 125 protein [Paenibacillus sp. LHD-38]MDQ8738467.1 glycoside hydrolase family 125 protein [Paenibacillus sp. LHD-38]